jgi:hypothetical protein
MMRKSWDTGRLGMPLVGLDSRLPAQLGAALAQLLRQSKRGWDFRAMRAMRKRKKQKTRRGRWRWSKVMAFTGTTGTTGTTARQHLAQVCYLHDLHDLLNRTTSDSNRLRHRMLTCRYRTPAQQQWAMMKTTQWKWIPWAAWMTMKRMMDPAAHCTPHSDQG